MMSTCRWCTSVGPGSSDLLRKYCCGSLSAEDEQAANDDLHFCLDCVVEYHRARDELPSLHKRLWELETSRLWARFAQASAEELEEDDLLIIQDDQEIQVPKFTAAEYENILRVPLTEMLKYPYLLGHSALCEMFVEALCKMENSNSFRVFDKYQGIYLLLVHPNETVRRWAIRTARQLGKVDRDDFYDLQDIFSSMFYVLQPDTFQDTDIDASYNPENNKMVCLPRHLYDSTNYKNYWLGICMLLTVLDAQAMDSLLLGPNKQTDIMQCILNTMEKAEGDESMDPFWPSLQCFMVILDRLGSKVWGQQIEPAFAFQAITGSRSYTTEIKNIRSKTMTSKVKEERPCDDDMVTCSQIIYESNIKEKRKDSSVRSSGCSESSSMIFEDMNSLVSVLQSNIGQDMRVHNSTFLWFIPFVESVMDLGDLSSVYIGEIIHFLYDQSKDLISGRIQTCDKVTEFFTLILVFIIDLHLRKSRMHVLCYSINNWLEVIVKCATLPCAAFQKSLDSGSNCVSSTSLQFCRKPQVSSVVPQACMQVIRSLLKEGGKLASHSKSMQFLDMLNKQIREVSLKEWTLAVTEVKELRNCLTQVVRLMKEKSHIQATDRNLDALTPPPASNNGEPCIMENCIQRLKTEPRLDSEQRSSKVFESRDHVDMKMVDIDVFSVKKEPNVTKENFESVSQLIPPLQQARVIPDPGKLRDLKTKLSPSLLHKLQDIAKKQSDSANVKVEISSNGEQYTVEPFTEGSLSSNSRCQDEPKVLRPSSSISESSDKGAERARCLSEGSEYGDDVPLSAVKGFLKKSQKYKSLETVPDFKVDRGLNQLDVATCAKGHKSPGSSPDVSGKTEEMEQKGKNKKGAARGDPGQHLKIVEPALDIIVISDSETDTEDDDSCDGRTTVDRFREEKIKIKSEPLRDTDFQKDPIHDDFSDIDSQMFEFETQEEVFSAWTDHKISSSVSPPEMGKELPSLKEQSVNPDPSDHILGYETEPVSEEIIENALLEVEAQLKEQKLSLKHQVRNAEKTERFVIPKVVPSKAPGKGSPHRKRKDVVKKTRSGEQSKKSFQEATPSESASKLPTSSFATPAIVPPKKVRKPAEPASAVEKLGLKKKERKAFDLSQRSLDCVGQLRKHGQGVQVEQKKPTRRHKKSKLISPQKLIVKGHKKLLASQDLQFFRQSRAKPQSLQSMSACEQTISKQCPDHIKKTNSKWDDILKPSITGKEQGKDKFDFSPSSPDSVDSIVDDAKKHSADEVDWHSDVAEDAQENADMHLTQMEPVDMEMCSQKADDDLFLTQRDPVDMDIESEDQISAEQSPWMDQLGEGQEKAVRPLIQKPSTSQQEDDKVFIRPGMSPLSCRNAKPSTTKIYAPSSRSATLVQEMEKSARPPAPAIKNKFVRPVLPIRRSAPQPEFKRPHSVNRSFPIQTGPVGSSPHVPSYKMYPRPETPVNKVTDMDSGFKFDQSVFIHTILRWNYDMFCSYAQFGIPSDLCNLPVKEVAHSYGSYKEYFETFYPLLLINTFEELAKDWEKSINSGQIITQHLKVIGSEYANQITNANFTACLSFRDVQNQLYPKEDDLVILWLPQNRSMYTCNEPELVEPRACFGCVSRSTVYSSADERSTLNLSIQTRANVSSENNQTVKCQLMGSLVSAIREFRALYMLKNNTMFRPVLAPQVTFFQPIQENILATSLPKYNSEQVKAIKWGVSIVKTQPRSPKICLIHGPPGTGKSKTIVGLLQSLFSEENSAATASRFSKACRLRVLLCAPSNAAIDNLMKKIILVFKDIRRNVKNPLGNCGDINLVRLGMEKTISDSLKPYSLDSQTRARTQRALQAHDMDDRRKQQLDQEIDNLSKKCALMKNTDQVQFGKLTDQKCKLLKEREKLGRQLRETRSRKQETQAKVLQDAHVICCTLSTSGSVVLESAFRRLGHEPFSCVIVDEAGQATELETLIPMLFRCPALILVGDPEQLPPTVVSQTAKEKKYDQSLMARLWKCLHRTTKENPHIPLPVVLLNKQYRMHPDICVFPSMHIYNNALKTDCDTAQSRCAVTWPFQPYILFDVTDGRETKEGESFCNHKEVKLVLILIRMILEKQVIRVGVITPYNAQKYRIQESVNREMAKEDAKRSLVEVDTVDGFQGREMDCIIVSCVRASGEPGSIGFLGSRQRMNVTITRAKYSLFILGHLRTLREQRDWGALIQDAGKRGTIIKTSEKDFKMHAKRIFKSGFMRSLSYPPKELGFPSLAKSNVAEKYSGGSSPTTSAGDRAVPFRPHQGTDSLQVGVATNGRSLAQLPSRPQTAERPRDPRLAAQLPRPKPDSGGQQERPHRSSSSLSRSTSWCPESQHGSRDRGPRESHQALPYMPHSTQGPQKRHCDEYSASTSAKKAKR